MRCLFSLCSCGQRTHAAHSPRAGACGLGMETGLGRQRARRGNSPIYLGDDINRPTGRQAGIFFFLFLFLINAFPANDRLRKLGEGSEAGGSYRITVVDVVAAATTSPPPLPTPASSLCLSHVRRHCFFSLPRLGMRDGLAGGVPGCSVRCVLHDICAQSYYRERRGGRGLFSRETRGCGEEGRGRDGSLSVHTHTHVQLTRRRSYTQPRPSSTCQVQLPCHICRVPGGPHRGVRLEVSVRRYID